MTKCCIDLLFAAEKKGETRRVSSDAGWFPNEGWPAPEERLTRESRLAVEVAIVGPQP
jgi:hypothetical protein